MRLWWDSTTVELLMGGDDGPGDDNPAGVQVVDVVHNLMCNEWDDLSKKVGVYKAIFGEGLA